MTVLRSLAIQSVVAAAAAASGAACGTVTSGSAPDAGNAGKDAMAPTTLFRSCMALLDRNPTLDNGAYTLRTAAGAPYQAYCDMEDDSGGWTLVLKVDGTAANSQFGYDNPLWTNTTTVKDDQVDTGHIEAKFRAFSEVAFSKIRIVMVDTQAGAMTLNVADTSFVHLMRGPFVQVANPRQDWLSLVPGAVVQANCNLGGINAQTQSVLRVRIGMLANEQADCNSPDSFIGIGGGGVYPGNSCYGPGPAVVPPTAGSLSGGSCNPTPGPNHAVFAYVYVR